MVRCWALSSHSQSGTSSPATASCQRVDPSDPQDVLAVVNVVERIQDARYARRFGHRFD